MRYLYHMIILSWILGSLSQSTELSLNLLKPVIDVHGCRLSRFTGSLVNPLAVIESTGAISIPYDYPRGYWGHLVSVPSCHSTF